MKDTLKSLKSHVTRRTLHELNREVTPFDLPALSPVPPLKREKAVMVATSLVDMEQDLVEVEEVEVGKRTAEVRGSSPGLLEDTPSGSKSHFFPNVLVK
jgi:hypothetical protein